MCSSDLMLVLRMSPMIFFGGLIGVLAEKINRRQLLLIGFWGVATSCAVLSLLVLTDEIELWHIGLGAFLNGMIWSADYAVRRTLLGRSEEHTSELQSLVKLVCRLLLEKKKY